MFVGRVHDVHGALLARCVHNIFSLSRNVSVAVTVVVCSNSLFCIFKNGFSCVILLSMYLYDVPFHTVICAAETAYSPPHHCRGINEAPQAARIIESIDVEKTECRQKSKFSFWDSCAANAGHVTTDSPKRLPMAGPPNKDGCDTRQRESNALVSSHWERSAHPCAHRWPQCCWNCGLE
eukprot:SAG31_NODE_2194_length_6224_cov_3.140408_5_plen_179_part_00